MSRFYQAHQFAELAGVTVKALYHYDRLGLLKPRRTDTGYRLYTERDLERLEQIVALEFLGLPLKQIIVVLDRATLELPDALRLQRKVLEEKQRLLSRAISAIQEAERAIEPGKPADSAILKKIIEVIEMQDGIEVMKKYYGTEEAWDMRRCYYEEGPSREWQELYRDVRASLGEDPGSEGAQALADHWLELQVRAASGDPEHPTLPHPRGLGRPRNDAALEEVARDLAVRLATGPTRAYAPPRPSGACRPKPGGARRARASFTTAPYRSSRRGTSRPR